MGTQQGSISAHRSSQAGKEAEGGGQSKQRMHREGRGVVAEQGPAPRGGEGVRRRLQQGRRWPGTDKTWCTPCLVLTGWPQKPDGRSCLGRRVDEAPD